jgi:predicted thioesterase
VDLSRLTIGLKGSSDLIVGIEHTAPRVGSGRVADVMEAAALAAVEHLLPHGHQSLGIHLDIRHFAATPVGMRIVANCELVAVEGRTLSFRVDAHDEKEPIGGGSHQRIVVNVARFDQRVQRKIDAAVP